MREHINSWYDFANQQLGIGLEVEDIIFVSGFTKTRTWAEATFCNCRTNAELHINVGAPVLPVSGEFSASMSQDSKALVFTRWGPVIQTNLETHDQCIFLNYLKIKRRILTVSVFRAVAGPHNLPEVSGQEREADLAYQLSDARSSDGLVRLSQLALSESHTVP